MNHAFSTHPLIPSFYLNLSFFLQALNELESTLDARRSAG